MTTNRAQWLILLGVAGSAVGVLLNKGLLAHASLAVLFWMAVEWMLFRWRVELQLRHLRCIRTVNGSVSQSGTLWTGRRVTVSVEIVPERPVRIPFVRFRDWMPENMLVESAADGISTDHETDASMTGAGPVRFEYSCRPRGAGSVQFRGVGVVLFDLHGLFFARRFIPAEQTFRVLPASVSVDAAHPMVKRVNALPPPGIHRLQRAGMGSELLELREYVPGDPPKAIAWKVSARRDQLMTREYESEVPVRTTLFVDCSLGTRYGESGARPLDQIVRLAASIARSAMTVRDPVGLAECDDAEVHYMASGAGDRHFFQMLDRLSKRAVSSDPPPVRFSQELLDEAWGVCGELYPELMVPKVNQVPFTWFPIRRGRRLERFQRTRMATVLTELYDLNPDEPQNLIHDDARMASWCQRFLIDAGYNWTWPVVDRRRSELYDWHGKFDVLARAMTRVVSRSHDHELFVLLVDLLDHPDPPGRLTDAIRLARARHHRVVLICPCPDDCRPGPVKVGFVERQVSAGSRDVDELLTHAERVRRTHSAERLQRQMRRLGVPVAFASDRRAVQLVLAEAELARSGRSSRAGAR